MADYNPITLTLSNYQETVYYNIREALRVLEGKVSNFYPSKIKSLDAGSNAIQLVGSDPTDRHSAATYQYVYDKWAEAVNLAISEDDALLLESGDDLLLESGDRLLLA